MNLASCNERLQSGNSRVSGLFLLLFSYTKKCAEFTSCFSPYV
jgi:hypothetical protein